MNTLGLRENWKQFSLLVVINGFVGGMFGLERTIIPKLAEEVFFLNQASSILTFITVFGIAKALTNYVAGSFAGKVGRKNLLLLGWVIALPVPLILMYTESWTGVIVANAFLGVHQGITWTTTVVMKIDIVGEKNRGLAMGVNESVGYLTVGIVAFATGWLASTYGIRPYPFYLGLVFVGAGFLLSLFVQDTKHHVTLESSTSAKRLLKNTFQETTLTNRNLSSVTQAGMINNLNDGMIWGILPMLLAGYLFDLKDIGLLVSVYPAVWGLGQLVTGKMADMYNKKRMLVAGMGLQGVAILGMAWATDFYEFVALGTILGVGTALVYPTFLASLAQDVHPQQRAGVIGVFRLWRDLGYAIGATLTGILINLEGMHFTIMAIGVLTLTSAGVVLFRMR